MGNRKPRRADTHHLRARVQPHRQEAGHLLREVHGASEHEGKLLEGLRRNAGLNEKPWPAAPQVRLRAISAPDRYCFAFVEEHSQAMLVVAPPWAATIER